MTESSTPADPVDQVVPSTPLPPPDSTPSIDPPHTQQERPGKAKLDSK